MTLLGRGWPAAATADPQYKRLSVQVVQATACNGLGEQTPIYLSGQRMSA